MLCIAVLCAESWCPESALGMAWGSFRELRLLVGWACRAGGGFYVAALDFCGPGLVPHLLVGLCVLFRRWVGREGSAPEPHSPGWAVDGGNAGVALACLLLS